MIRARLVQFLVDDSGAVTLDWLALIAAAVGVAVLAVGIVGQGTRDISADIDAALRSAQLESLIFRRGQSGQGSGAVGSGGAAEQP